MASQGILSCDIHSNEQSIEWCTNCLQCLCFGCSEYHSKSNATKHHERIFIENYTKLPNFLKVWNQICQIHDDSLDYYCKTHKELYCFYCVTTFHKECSDIQPVADIPRNEIISETMTGCEELIREMNMALDYMIQSRSRNIADFSKQKASCINKIKAIRREINNHLDSLEKKIKEDINAKIEAEKITVKEVLEDCSHRKKELEKLINEVGQIKSCASSLQKLFAVPVLKRQIHDFKQALQNMSEDDRLFNVQVLFDRNENVRTFSSDFVSLGNVSVYKAPNQKFQDYSFLKKVDRYTEDTPEESKSTKYVSDKNANISTFEKTNIHFGKFKYSQQGRSTQITACEMLPNGQIMVLDWEESALMSADRNALFQHRIKFTSKPYDFVSINNDIIAATLRSAMYVTVVEMKTGKELKRYKTQNYCYGITYYSYKLYVSVSHLRIVQVFEHNSGMELDVIKTPYSAFNITIFQEKLYCTNKDRLIFCCSFDGELIWEFRQSNIEPFCISIDCKGFSFVACRNKVIKISPDGTCGTELSHLNKMLVKPRAAAICSETNQLLVCSEKTTDYVITNV